MKEPESRLRNLWSEAREVSLGTAGEIDRLDEAPTPLRFLRDYVSPNKPCIISSSAYTARRWPAVSRSLWESDPDYLTNSLPPHHSVSLHLTPDGRADSLLPHPDRPSALCFATPLVRSVNFSDAIHFVSTSDSWPPVVAYAQQQNDCFRTEYSPLADGGDVELHIPWATEAFGGGLPDAVNLWIGSARSVTSFHKDHYENLYVVVTGQKHFLLVPPSEVHRMYIRRYPAARYVEGEGQLRLEVETPEREVPWCSVDPCPSSEEEMERQRRCFPLFYEGPPPYRCTLNAGDILYLPSMWFHHVTQSPDRNGRTIAVNYWYDMQFDIKYAYFNFLQSIDCANGSEEDSENNVED